MKDGRSHWKSFGNPLFASQLHDSQLLELGDEVTLGPGLGRKEKL